MSPPGKASTQQVGTSRSSARITKVLVVVTNADLC